jgi:lipoprotein NlpI
MRAWAVLMTAVLFGCTGSAQRGGGETSTPDTVIGDFDACDTADFSPGIEALIVRCNRALNSGLMPEDPTATALIRRGNLYAFKGDYDLARQDFDRVIAMKPMAKSIRGNRAVVEFLQGDDVAAFQDYEAAGASSEYDWNAPLERGIAYRYRGEHEKAIADFSRAYRRMSSDPKILVNRGFSYVTHGDYALALADFDRALKLEPDFLPREIAIAAKRGGPDDFKRAVPGHDHDITLKPDYFLLQRARGFALFMLGRTKEAAEALQIYGRSQREDTVGSIMFLLAALRTYDSMSLDIDDSQDQAWPKPILHYLRGNATREEVLKAAGTSDPQRECSARFYFGEVDLTAGRRDAAKTEFERAVALCPKGAFEGPAAATELGRI